MALEQQPGPFNMRDLTLDVRLEAIVEGTRRDFTGKKIFSVDFFRKGISFGITNIDIEVNTSLQPIITITFKDLYGNTVFGKTRTANSDITDSTGEENDFSVLFNWPPPKFLFTFKGFLGHSATWVLNMKKSSVSYDSSDGSYDIKCEFVPNQWGFLSDLPFLFLLAVKSLKKKSLAEAEFNKVQTIFDLIKIGKQVEVKTKETTKEFDNILKQMTLLKSLRVYDAVSISKVINFDETIDGQVGNQSIANFNAIKINSPKGGGNTAIDSAEKMKSYGNSADGLNRINAFLLLSANIGGLPPVPNVTFDTVSKGVLRESIPGFDAKIAERQALITKNIENIENAIKRKTYDSSKTQLEKITIGEVFRQLAEDAGYIMGRILEAGYRGYVDNEGLRKNDPNLIGRNFPLCLSGENSEEKPATAVNFGKDVGVETGELQFVNDFIDSISEGIATELAEDTSAADAAGSNLIKKRICNLEALKENPYKPFFQSIAENILVRGGIVGYLVRSPDPNYPGDYATSFYKLNADRATEAEDIISLADADLENITDSMISQLSDSDFKALKNFCVFWDNLLTEDCENLRVANSDGVLEEGADIDTFLSSPGDDLNTFLLDYEVMIEKPAQWDGKTTISFPTVRYEPREGLQVTTLRKVMSEIFRPASGNGGTNDTTNSRFIDLNKLQAKKLVNNGIAYFNPQMSVGDDEHVFVMFDGPDATKTQEVMSSDSDAEIKGDADSQREETDFRGFLNIQNPFEEDSTDFIEPIIRMNDEAIPDRLLLNYSRLVNPSNAFFQNNTNTDDTQNYFFAGWPQGATQAVLFGNPDNLESDRITPKGITLSVAFHPAKTELVFGPFAKDGPNDECSNVHRGYIKRMCTKLKEKLDGVEQKRNQIISDVLGKSGEQKDLLYKQMHVLYQQWEVLMIKDSDSANNQDTKGFSRGEVLAELENRYKGAAKHIDFKIVQSVADSAADNTFLYSYPLGSIPGRKEVNVKNSLINIEPLYKPNGSTTVLNIIQQICTKNNFIFIPMPGESSAFSTAEIFSPQVVSPPKVKNFFYVQFAPTPESRSKLSNDDGAAVLSFAENLKDNAPPGTFLIKFGSPENQIVKNVTVDTQESKATAESIVNLQRLVDNENQNKKVTTDCSMLPVMEGRSYKSTIDMLGNAQVFPMQFFFLDSIPLFNGLYQIMKVKHSIKPNDMSTSAEGIRMRMDYGQAKFGGIQPITLDTLKELPELTTAPPAQFQDGDFANAVLDQGAGAQDGSSGTQVVGGSGGAATPVSTSKGGSDIKPSSTVSSVGVILPPDLRAVKNSIRLTQSSDGNNAIAIGDTDSTYTKDVIIRNLNEFITDVLGPFATFLKQNYPNLYKNWYITSAQRNYVPAGGSKISQHQKGQAIDSQIVIGSKGSVEWQKANLEFLNAILTWYQQNPVGYDQILWETRKPGSNWIHWSYKRNDNRLMLLRFVDDKTNRNAKVNTTGKYVSPGVTEAQIVLGI